MSPKRIPFSSEIIRYEQILGMANLSGSRAKCSQVLYVS